LADRFNPKQIAVTLGEKSAPIGRITVTRQELHVRIDDILNTAEREKTFGTIEFELRNGKITILRTIKTERIESPNEGNNPHGNSYR
jgi:hypothetical protein